jgi:hypothetical protein
METEGNFANIVLAVVFIAAVSMLFFSNVGAMTGHATFQSTVSNVSISKYFAILPSPELVEGIFFGNVETLGVSDINATENNQSANAGTLYYINVSEDSNTAVDFCLKALTNLTAGGATIPAENETYWVENSTNATDPNVLNQVPIDINATGYGAPKSITISEGNVSYWRFWLDVPLAQEAGSYENIIYFKGIQEAGDCNA